MLILLAALHGSVDLFLFWLLHSLANYNHLNIKIYSLLITCAEYIVKLFVCIYIYTQMYEEAENEICVHAIKRVARK